MFDRAAWRRLDEFVAPDGPGAHRFRHALMRDAAYEGLSFRRRRELHARVGDAICERTARRGRGVRAVVDALLLRAAVRRRVAVLADGRRPSAGPIRQRRRGRVLRACDRRSRRRSTRLTAKDVIDAHLALGEVYERLGRYDDAKDAYQQARRMLQGRSDRGGAIWLRESWLPERVGNYSLCIRLVNRALEVPRGRRGRGGRGASNGPVGRVRVASATSKGRNREAIEWGRRRPRRRSGSATGRDAHRPTCRCRSPTRTPATSTRAERYSELALALYEELEQLEPQAQVLNNMGTFSYFAGRWNEAVERWDRSRELRLRTGRRGRGRERDEQRRRGAVRPGAPGGGRGPLPRGAPGVEGRGLPGRRGLRAREPRSRRVPRRSAGRRAPDAARGACAVRRVRVRRPGAGDRHEDRGMSPGRARAGGRARRSPTARWPSSRRGTGSVISVPRCCGREPTRSPNSGGPRTLRRRSRRA